MNMLADALAGLSGSPYAWAGVALLAVISAYWLYSCIYCPVLRHAEDITIEEARAAVNRPVTAGARFLVMMLIGIAALVSGLSLLYRGADPGVAFLLVLAGLVITQTEPARQQVRETMHRVVASRNAGPEVTDLAVQRLESSYIWLVVLHFIILASAVLALLVF
ncbi:MAG: hypothetical protein AAFR17_05625 [Pseudomonadota bacterium]